jgi:hypothetical protein
MEVNIEMGGNQVFPTEVSVLDLVLTKRGRTCRGGEQKAAAGERGDSPVGGAEGGVGGAMSSFHVDLPFPFLGAALTVVSGGFRGLLTDIFGA